MNIEAFTIGQIRGFGAAEIPIFEVTSVYTEAKPGTFRLVPRAERLPELRRDYQLMRDMYLTEPVSFDDILSSLSELEHRINLTTPLLSLGETLIEQI